MTGQCRHASSRWGRCIACGLTWTEQAKQDLPDMPETPEPADLIGMLEVAEIFSVPQATVYTWRHRGVLPDPWAQPSGHPVWWRETIVAWGHRSGRTAAMARVTA